jgi:uncharacterized protein (DUF1499 family)
VPAAIDASVFGPQRKLTLAAPEWASKILSPSYLRGLGFPCGSKKVMLEAMWWKLGAIVLVAPVVLYVSLAMIYGRLGLLERAFGPIHREQVDFATLELKPSPNQYLVCPRELCRARPHAQSPEFDVSLEALRAAWIRVIQRQPRVTLLSSDSDTAQYEYQALTPMVHFPDGVTVRLLPAGEGHSTLAIYSRSHYGYGDLGENRRRVRGWLEQLGEELETKPGQR